MPVVLMGASFPDVFPGGFAYRGEDERTVTVVRTGAERWAAAPDILRYLKADVSPAGEVRGVAQSGNTVAGLNRLMIGGPAGWRITDWPCVAVDGCDIAWHGDHWDVVVQDASDRARRLHFRNGLEAAPADPEEIASPTGGTGFGFLGFDPSKSGPDCLRWTDANRAKTVDGLLVRFPQPFANGETWQYSDNPDWLGGVADGVKFTLATEQVTGAPRVAELGGRVTIVAPLADWRIVVAEGPPWPAFVPVPSDPPPPPKDDMTPNLLSVGQRVFSEHPDLAETNSRDSCGRLTEYIVWALSRADRGFGHLSKQPGQNQFNGHAVDATIYAATQQVVDLIVGAGAREDWIAAGRVGPDPGPARPDWNEVEKRPGNEWIPAFDPGDDPPPPPPPPDDDVLDAIERVLERLSALAGDVQAVQARQATMAERQAAIADELSDVRAAVARIEAAVEALSKAPGRTPPKYVGSVDLGRWPTGRKGIELEPA